MKKKDKCCICGKVIKGYGNETYPVKEGRCCDACNLKWVIPSRFRMYNSALAEIKKEDN